MTLVLRRSAAPVADFRRLNQWVDDAFNTWPFAAQTGGWVPAVDIVEGKDGIRLIAELPGLAPADVTLTLENRTLTIKGEKKAQGVEEKGATVHRYERSYGSFERGFTLPEGIDGDRVQASFEHGVLTVTLPKAEQAKPRAIVIKAS